MNRDSEITSRIVSAIYRKPRTMEEIAIISGISKEYCKMKVSTLLRMGVVERLAIGKDKKIYYSYRASISGAICRSSAIQVVA